VTITIMIHVVASSTNMTTYPERRLWNRVRVHVITRKKEDLTMKVVPDTSILL
jgi:hypothetical protein